MLPLLMASTVSGLVLDPWLTEDMDQVSLDELSFMRKLLEVPLLVGHLDMLLRDTARRPAGRSILTQDSSLNLLSAGLHLKTVTGTK